MAPLTGTAVSGTISLAEIPWPAPVAVPNAVEGTPMSRIVYLVDDTSRQAGIWSCSTGAFESNHCGYVECVHIVDGAAELRGEDGTVWKVGPGTLLVIPDGWVGTWHVTKPITKSFAIFRAAPEAGPATSC
ncbi:protein of unknown function DUF861, cupin_3 [Nocardioides sp. JS614]|nr:protein of unknown function DUF861, cupin_3 [Nocardioides sp. JS614]